MFAVSLTQPSFLPINIKSSKSRSAYFSTKIVASTHTTTAENRVPCFGAKKMASSLYEVLGIPMGASCLEIKAAYRKLARTCHPDVVAMNQKESSANQFMMIHLAYSTLSDPNKRALYDREIYGHKRSATMVSTMSGKNQTFSYAGRKWETDQCW